MKYLTIALVIFAVIAIIAVAVKVLGLIKGKGKAPSHYEAKAGLLTPAELKFLGMLDQLISTHYRIMAQVRLADVIKVKKGLDDFTRSSISIPCLHRRKAMWFAIFLSSLRPPYPTSTITPWEPGSS